jgi:hypothetical protein
MYLPGNAHRAMEALGIGNYAPLMTEP